MKRFHTLVSAAFITLALCSCSKEVNLNAQSPKWDIQTCDRCKMLLSDKKFSAQVVNPSDGKHYFFDDLGCALLWLEGNEAKAWSDKAIIYATDPANGKWLNVKENQIVSGYVTPMAYGLGVLPKGAKIECGKTALSFEQALEQVDAIKKQKAASKMHHNP